MQSIRNIITKKFAELTVRKRLARVFFALLVMASSTASGGTIDAYPADATTVGVRLILEEIGLQGRATIRVLAGSNNSPEQITSLELNLRLSDGASLIAVSKSPNIISWVGPVVADLSEPLRIAVAGTPSSGFEGEREVLNLEIQLVDGNQQISEFSGYLNETEFASDLPMLLRMPDDTDGDFVSDENDAFPNDSSESVDTDGDGVGDNADRDDDGDTIADEDEDFPLDPSRAYEVGEQIIGLFTRLDVNNVSPKLAILDEGLTVIALQGGVDVGAVISEDKLSAGRHYWEVTAQCGPDSLGANIGVWGATEFSDRDFPSREP